MAIGYGGGVSSVKQLNPVKRGSVAVWFDEGILVDGAGAAEGLVSETPADGYSLCAQWFRAGLAAADTLYAPVTFVPFPEAPRDGQYYVRDGLTKIWVTASFAGGGIPEAPTTGGPWGRKAGAWVEVVEEPNRCRDLLTSPIEECPDASEAYAAALRTERSWAAQGAFRVWLR